MCFCRLLRIVNIFSQSDLIIFSKKFNSQYKVFFKKNNKKVFFVEDLADSKIKLVKVIHKLFEKYNSISYLKVGDTFLFFENYEELFFKKKKIQVEKVLGIPNMFLFGAPKSMFGEFVDRRDGFPQLWLNFSGTVGRPRASSGPTPGRRWPTLS